MTTTTTVDSTTTTTTSLVDMTDLEMEPCSSLGDYIQQALPSLRTVFAPIPTHLPPEAMKVEMQKRAETLQEEFHGMSKNIHYNHVTLGWMLNQASLFDYHTYAPGYRSGETLKDWVCREVGVYPSIYDHAWELGKAWEFLQESQVPLAIITDERFTKAKAQHVNQMQRDSGRQIKAIEEKMASESSSADKSEIKREAREQFLSDVRSSVMDLVINVSDHDLKAEVARAAGEKERPTLYLHLKYRHGKITGTVDSLCDIENLEALMQGKYNLAFCIEGIKSPVSPRQIGEAFYELAAAEEEDQEDF